MNWSQWVYLDGSHLQTSIFVEILESFSQLVYY
jgi:hypothetical protein